MTHQNPNARLEAFSDGVFAIALTLLVIDVRIPAPESITDTGQLWHALRLLTPTVLAFLLSFGVILITWVNHHAALKLVDKTTTGFMYANGLMLLTVVFIPFPTALLGAFVLTDHAAPAVVLYNAVLTLQAISWVLVSGTALKGGLIADAGSAAAMKVSNRNGYFATVLYAFFTLAAWWFPLPIAIITTLTWIFWLVLSIGLKHDAR